MKPDQKRAIAFVVLLSTCTGVGLISSAAVSIAGYNHEVFFDESFSFLNHYAVNDFIPATAVVMAVIGWLCGLWTMRLIQPNAATSARTFLWRIFIGFLPFFLIFTVLFLLGQQAGGIYRDALYRGMGVFARNLPFFFEGGLFLGFSIFMYGRMQQEQKPVSE